MQILKKTKRTVARVVLLVSALSAAWEWRTWCRGLSYVEMRDAIRDESELARDIIDSRCDTAERKLGRIKLKLGRLRDSDVQASQQYEYGFGRVRLEIMGSRIHNSQNKG